MDVPVRLLDLSAMHPELLWETILTATVAVLGEPGGIHVPRAFPMGDLTATVKSREIQRAMLAEMASDRSAAARHFLGPSSRSGRCARRNRHIKGHPAKSQRRAQRGKYDP